jgi:hypothetical protein
MESNGANDMSANARGQEHFQSDRVSSEYEQMLNAAESQGFKDGANGFKCQPKAHGFYGAAATLYQISWKQGRKSAV